MWCSAFLAVESSESSGESVSGFSGSDRSYLSVIGGDADETYSITSTLPPKTGHAHQAPPPGPAPKPKSPGQVAHISEKYIVSVMKIY